MSDAENAQAAEQEGKPEAGSTDVSVRSGGIDVQAEQVSAGGDVVGRDKVVQETVAGDKIVQQNVYHIYGAPPPGVAAPVAQPGAPATRAAQVFISYKRNTALDEPLALQIFRTLGGRGHKPFIDQAMRIGVDWAKEIQRQVEGADFFVVLLSPDSAHSEMVAAEIDYAHRHQSVHGRPAILPVRVAFTGALPYQLSTSLDRLQYAMWRNDADTQPVIEALVNSIETAEALPRVDAPAAVVPGAGRIEIADDGRALGGEQRTAAPLPSFDPRLLLEAPSGAVKLSSQFYIEREGDDDLSRQILGDGTTTTIRAPRQMGKTSLLVRGVQAARKVGQQIVYVDLQRVDQSYLTSMDGLLKYLAEEFATRLDLDPDIVTRAWASSRGAQDKLNLFLERRVLPEVETPILLAIDEADRLLGMPYKTDFFGLLRAWDSNRAYDEIWQRLNIAIVISTHPHLLITDISQSPFNVGLRLQLSDFRPAQVAELNRRHGSPVEERDLSKFVELFGGHPYLTRQALYTMVDQKLGWPELSRAAPADDGPFGSHLRTYLWQLSERQDLVRGMIEVLMRGRCSDETILYRLNAAGLVRESGDRVEPRCGLYREYFGAKLR